MSSRNVTLVPEEYYHIYNRGNSKQIIFKDKSDYRRFIELLHIANTSEQIRSRDFDKNNAFDFETKDKLVYIGAYCLMPNHFHILFTPVTEEGSAKFMLKLATAYVMYFNKKYERKGSLFEGPYKSEYIDSDRYLKYIFSYIHLNPVKLIQSNWKNAGISSFNKTIKYLDSYPYSSFIDFSGTKRPSSRILSIEAFPSYFPSKNLFQQEIFDWLIYSN